MLSNINTNKQLNFGTHLTKAARALIRKGIEVPCAYSGEAIKPGRDSFEHILPDSLGGVRKGNGLEVIDSINCKRKNQDFQKWIKTGAKNAGIEDVTRNIQGSMDFWRKVKLTKEEIDSSKDFDGEEYVRETIPTLNRLAGGVVRFRGNNKELNTHFNAEI